MLNTFIKTITRKRMSSHLLVLLQLCFVALCCYPFAWHNAGSPWFLLLCVAGIALGIIVLYYNSPSNFSVYPEIRSGAKLITAGPYRIIRHPMYSALMLMMMGIAGYNGHWVNYIASLGLILVVTVKALREERLLIAEYEDYADYTVQTKRFVPYLL